ncbi:hypothetical protein BD626DRAFT_484638 [Schizophyllum amplum]|uniref:F-box domain-containing protein n=1 Tax=Schizophyllum amplum TaxID=97359 RepID=A0A550CQL6_9AGAR|nr:hypothetical protein BD626DRAFT_484638 [Auriculariopsis ampla]
MINPLDIPEIGFAICQQCSRRSLCRLALVSKYWHAVSDFLLWESIPGLVCLLSLMPEDAWEVNNVRSPGGLFFQFKRVFRFRRPLTPKDWEPVLRRSLAVRVLDQTALGRRRVVYTQDAIDVIAACPPHGKLCPELRRLDIRASGLFSTNSSSHLASVLISPTMTSFTLSLDAGCSVPADCSALAQACPRLRTLVIRERVGDPKYINAIINAFHRHPTLDRVTLHASGPSDALEVVAGLPSLTTLEVQSLTRVVPVLNMPHPTRLFTALTSLTLEGCTFAIVCAMMCAWDWRPIRVLVLEAVVYESAWDFRILMQHIRAHCDPSALTNLTIHGHNPDEVDVWPLTIRDLAPLPRLPNLVQSFVTVPYSDVLSDSDWGEIVARFPSIQAFRLQTEDLDDNVARVSTLESLLHFANGCPRLQFLCLPIARVIAPPDYALRLQSPQQSLAVLDIMWGITIEDADDAVNFLNSAFSGLGTVVCATHRSTADGHGFEEQDDADEPWARLKRGVEDNFEKRRTSLRTDISDTTQEIRHK